MTPKPEQTAPGCYLFFGSLHLYEICFFKLPIAPATFFSVNMGYRLWSLVRLWSTHFFSCDVPIHTDSSVNLFEQTCLPCLWRWAGCSLHLYIRPLTSLFGFCSHTTFPVSSTPQIDLKTVSMFTPLCLAFLPHFNSFLLHHHTDHWRWSKLQR